MTPSTDLPGKPGDNDAVLQTVLILVALYGAYSAGFLHLRGRRAESPARRVPWATVVLLVAVGAVSALQFAVPGLLPALRRDAAQVAAGEWWRLGTSFFVQDGGVAGTVFNLVALLLVGAVAEFLWGARRWLLIFFAGGLAANLVALAWQPVGAGNSIATMSLAGSICVYCLRRHAARPEALIAAAALGAGAALVLLRDIHGAAMLAGAVLGLLLDFL